MDRFCDDETEAQPNFDLDSYFEEQAGNGISTYGGYRYSQPVNIKGGGFFGRLISGGLMPILRKIIPYAGKRALSTVTDVVSSMNKGKSIKGALKSSLKRTASTVMKDAIEKMGDNQEGDGVRKKTALNKGLQKIFANRAKGRAKKGGSKSGIKHKRPKAKCSKKKKKKRTKKKGKKRSNLSRSRGIFYFDTMSLIHEMSSTTTLPEFDLFKIQPTQKSVWRDVITEHRPITVYEQGAPIPYEFRTERNEYLKFYESSLYLQLKITLAKDDKSKITHDDWTNVVPVNNLLHSLFDRIDLEVNQTRLVMSPTNYAYRAYLEKLLGFSNTVKDGYLSCCMWGDRGDRTDAITPDSKQTDQSEVVIDLMDRLHLDLSFQNRAFVGNSNFKITLHPKHPEFYLGVATGYTVTCQIKDPILYIHRAIVTDSLSVAINKALRISPAKYPISRTEIKQFTLEKGVTDKFLNNVITGILPRRIFVMMVDTIAYAGKFSKNPFQFDNNNLNYLACYIGGTPYPVQPMTPNFEKNLFVKEYVALYQSLNQNGTDAYTQITRKEFKDGFTIFAINLTPDLSSGPGAVGHYNLVQRGELRMHLRFASEIKNTTTVLVFQEYDSIIEIDEIGQINTNYTA